MKYIAIQNIPPELRTSASCFVDNHPAGNIFQTMRMLDFYNITKNYEPLAVLVTNDENEIQGMLIALIQREHNGILRIFSSRSIIWGGPLIRGNNLDVLDAILKAYSKLAKNQAIYTQFRNTWEWSDNEKAVFKKNGYRYFDHLNILIDLSKPASEILASMHQGRRKNIRRAERVPLIFGEATNKAEIERCFQLIKNTYNKIGLPVPDSTFFHDISKLLGRENRAIFFTAKFNQVIIASRVVFCYNHTIYDWYAGSDNQHHDKYPNDFLPFKIMEWGSQNGYKSFDFGGAGSPNKHYGVRDFKSKFGGEIVNFGRFEKVHNKLLMLIGKIGLVFYKKYYGIRKKLLI